MAGYTERLENRGLNSFALRIIGWVTMTWGAAQEILNIKDVDWATYMLWFSFTIFAFLLCEGLQKSTSRRLYFRRLLLFTVVSEPIYDLYYCGRYWDISRQSIMVTLLIGFIVIAGADFIKKRYDNMILTVLALAVLSYGGTVLAVYVKSEMGLFGILLIDFLYISLNVTYTRLMELLFFAVFISYAPAENYLNIIINDFCYSIPDTSFCLLAVALTWFYNGKRGPNSTVLKVIYYLFYPFMLLVLCLVKNYLA